MASFENQKSKIQKFVNFTFIIHENRNKTCVQPNRKSNSISFMSIILFVRWIFKKLSTGGGGQGE